MKDRTGPDPRLADVAARTSEEYAEAQRRREQELVRDIRRLAEIAGAAQGKPKGRTHD
jgi:hypothetical protein